MQPHAGGPRIVSRRAAARRRLFREVIDSDWAIYGGSGVANEQPVVARCCLAELQLLGRLFACPLGVLVLKPMRRINGTMATMSEAQHLQTANGDCASGRG